ncbi:MAG: ATP-binding protein [Pirellulaceae bacterium]
MTGSGKTGLCLGLLEEAGLDRIPAIVIDPKGDISNLLLTFPDLSPKDFEPWVDPGQATREGKDISEFAASEADKWKKGLAKWGQDGERIRKLRETVDMHVYTPGSTAGRPLTILKSFNAPSPEVMADSDALRERISSAASGLLALLGIDADPIRSREHILVSQILNAAWAAGKDLDLGTLIGQIQSPPFERVGIMELDTFFPSKDRMELAMTLNNLLASPSFASWMTGESLNIKNLLHDPGTGKPRISVLSIAHLNDAERMFFVTILLNEVLAWMRTQAGTSSLRALLYMDEVFGYFPPTKNPPSKQPMLTLLKQARAFGLGVVLATQNPVDLDYKGLSNTGTWFLGRLQTERDKMRVIEGLEGAAAQSGSSFDRNRMEQILAGLGARKFLMNNVHDDQPVVFETRWAMSYLRGPMTRQQIQQLMESDQASKSEASAEANAAAPPTTVGSAPKVAAAPPITNAAVQNMMTVKPTQLIPSEIKQRFLEPTIRLPDGKRLVYRPALYANGSLHFAKSSMNIDAWEKRAFLQTIVSENVPNELWTEDARVFTPDDLEWCDEPHEDAGFITPPNSMQTEKSYKGWERDFKDFMYKTQNMLIYECSELPKTFSNPNESKADFVVRLETQVSEYRDRETEKLRAAFTKKFESIRDDIDRAEAAVERERAQYKSKRLESILDVGGSIMGALLGRKSRRRTSTTVKKFGEASEQHLDVKQAEEKRDALVAQYKDLDVEFNREMAAVATKTHVDNLTFEEILLPPRKSDLSVDEFYFAWVPYFVDESGDSEPAF